MTMSHPTPAAKAARLTRYDRQGKCDECRTRYVWTGSPLLRNATCPVHGSPLGATSHQSAYQVSRVDGAEVAS